MKSMPACLLISLGCLSATCRKWDCSQTDYSFEAFFKAYPDRDSIRIGDTIWLELQTPTQLKDLMSGQIVDYSGAVNLGTAISYLEIIGGIGDPPPIPSANDFDYIIELGDSSPTDKTNQIRAYIFREQSGTYSFKLGIIPKRSGLFLIAPGNATNVYRKHNKCSKAGFNLTFKETNQRLNLYEQKRPGYILSDYDKGHLYAFKVY